MNILFFGTADFAVPSLDALVSAGHNVLGVVTQPDKPTGRGMQLSTSPVKAAALKHGLQLYQPRRVKAENFIQAVRDINPDLIVLAAFGQIMPQSLLDIPAFGPINVHGSLLPAYRGAAPIQRAIMEGKTITGVTTMWMDATLDTGDILLRAELPILEEDTTGDLFPKLADLGANLLLETINGLLNGTVARNPQDDRLATLAPRIDPADTLIDWNEHAVRIVNRVRGLSPRPGAFTVSRGKRVKVWKCAAAADAISEIHGKVLGIQKNPPAILVSAGGGSAVLLKEVQPESNKRMAADAWARGLRLEPGEVLGG